MKDRVGQQLGNYHLIRSLGRGGFAEVYLGEHIHLKTLAAIKVLHTQMTPEAQQEFLQEARTIATLEHPNIIRLLEYGIEDTLPFLIMNYAPNGTVRQNYPQGTVLPLNVIISFLKQVASALLYAHNEQMIHRDVKPENMLIGRHNDVLLSDFGAALVTHREHLMSTQNIMGTPAYMAPEQFLGKPYPASDQYALSVVVYEWLCGERPFSQGNLAFLHNYVTPPSLREKRPDIPLAVEQVIMQALAKEPGQRFASIQEFALKFEAAWQSHLFLPTLPGKASQDIGFDKSQQNVPSPHPDQRTYQPKKLQQVDRPFVSPPAQQTSKRLFTFLISCLCLLAIVIGGSFLFVYSLHVSQRGSGISTTTRITHPTSTASLPRYATATFVAANPNPYQPDSGSLALYDPLSKPDQWYNLSFSPSLKGDCHFTHQTLLVQANDLEHFIYCPNKTLFKDLTFEVQMTILQGDCGGMVFRTTGATGNNYLFSVCQDGTFFLSLLQNNMIGQTLQQVTSSSAIQTGPKQTNTLAVLAKGSELTLYVNYQKLTTITDTTYSQGQIGVVAFPLKNATEVSYNDARVWVL